MPTTILGLPLHPLIVHATVVIVPLAALSVVLAAVLPRFRAWAGPLPMGLAVIGAVLCPLSTSTGESLRSAVGNSKAVQEHAELGELLLWAVLPMALLAAAAWFLRRKGKQGGAPTILSALAALAGVAALVLAALIGHTGATAAWCGQAPQFSKCPSGPVAPSGD